MTNTKLTPAIKRERLIESIYHVVYIGNTTRSLHNVFCSVADKLDSNEKNVIRYSIQSNVMLDTISLLDEMNKFLFKRDDSIDKVLIKKIESFKYIIKPILKSISKWRSLREFRNNVLAHNFRIDSDNFKSVLLNNELRNYVIPASTMDLLTLFQYINQITKIAEEIFKTEYEEALGIISSFDETDIKIDQSLEEETDNVNRIIMDVNNRIKEYNEGVL
jgi:hypothetical protein